MESPVLSHYHLEWHLAVNVVVVIAGSVAIVADCIVEELLAEGYKI